MAEATSAENLRFLAESIEQLNMEMTSVPSVQCDQSDPHADDSVDIWGEDGVSDNSPDDGESHGSGLNWEWNQRHDRFHTMGYREGITKGKEASAQEGFDVGFKQAVGVGYNWGLVRGITSALASLSDRTRENLGVTLGNKDRFQNLNESVQSISTNDALKIFHGSILQIGSKQSHEHSEGNFQVMAKTDEESDFNQLESLSKELVSLLPEFPEIKVNAELGKEMARQKE